LNLFYKKILNTPFKNWILSLCFFCVLWACDPTKKLLPQQYLVKKVEVLNTKETNLSNENFEAFIRQKPNRKLFRSINFYVWWYNLFDEAKIKSKKDNRSLKYDSLNLERVRKNDLKNINRVKNGKKIKPPKLKDKDSPLVRESIRDIGEPAVILDSVITEQTRSQLSKYLFSKGFFNNKVTDTILFEHKKKRATVQYILLPELPYKINNITYKMDDEKLGSLLLSDTINSVLKRGAVYDVDKFQKERTRLTDYALNNGYYYFESAYLSFDIDSNVSNHTVDVQVKLKKFSQAYSASNDSLIFVNHVKYKIQNIYIITEAVVGNLREASFKDTLKIKNKTSVYLLNNPLPYRQVLIASYIDIYKNQLFRKDTAEMTYKQLIALGIFKNVSIQFIKNSEFTNRLDCYIICNPLIKQSFVASTEGTNTSGNLGIDGSTVYNNKNLFKGGEFVELKLQGSISAQQQLSSSVENTNINPLKKTFNTIQFGPEFSFSVPRAFFPFSLLPFKKEMSPRTFIKSSLNYQSSQLFSRIITDIGYGFNFKTNQNRFRHEITPFEAYYVDANLFGDYEEQLIKTDDAFLLNSFLDHITTLSRYAVTYTSKENSNTSRKVVSYMRWSIQSSGNILRKYYELSGKQPDSLNRYLIFKIPFAQFFRTDIDYRIYVPIRKKSRLVYRAAGGIGQPLTNLNVLPYEQSFFSGGPNSNRAWRARTLGPGGYNPTNSLTRFDKIGDILLEGNIEYRFHIIKSFNGALFVDASNIWRLKPDPIKPNSQFIVQNFHKEIAIGSGIGIRWDLQFFIIRLDLATPIRDPKFEESKRWRFNQKPLKIIVANFGIGYPF